MESSRSNKLKQRLARMFRSPSLLRSPCKPSASAATNLSSTASTRALFDDAVHEPVFVPRRRGGSLDDHLGRSFSSTVPTVAVARRRSVDYSGCRPTCAIECSQPAPLVAKNEKWRDLKARKKERRVRETGGYYETGEWEGRTCPPASPSSPSKSSYYYYCFNGDVKEEKEGIKRKKKKKKKKKKKRVPSNSYRFSSSSSMESDVQEDGFFSSEEREGKEEETETFFSSRSFSSDSSEFYQRPTSKEKNKNKNKRNPERPQRRRARKYEAWGVCKGFQPLVSITRREKKGFAVVKRSSDPYNDFRSSMLEMITERQIFGAEDLECLLQSYLSLNSPHLHPLILQAFSDIWVVLFGH
ncbi:unnamed protein product [Musa acuminata subsp. malaccensis]|uniref:Transcription repressor n=1 Tax=Musa acuminata subsp. malaccensis TaxID=214687 RepID=A0A804K8F4_MUSAM|nr:PREDICTED: transcription repressor OFP7-like [Musa acuminata subsp. malaccensis]CAG1832113.1 unnamed protein product [Musa acuminata subsp. malaccensis]